MSSGVGGKGAPSPAVVVKHGDDVVKDAKAYVEYCGLPEDTVILSTSSGSQTFATNVEIMKHINLWKNKNKYDAIVLILDNHPSHYSIDIIELAMKNKIYLLYLPTNCTGWIQVLDLSHFQQMRAGTINYIKEHHEGNIYIYITYIFVTIISFIPQPMSDATLMPHQYAVTTFSSSKLWPQGWAKSPLQLKEEVGTFQASIPMLAPSNNCSSQNHLRPRLIPELPSLPSKTTSIQS